MFSFRRLVRVYLCFGICRFLCCFVYASDEYVAALDEIRSRSDVLEHSQLQRLYLGLIGDPVRAKIAKEANTILKGVGKAPPPSPGYRSLVRRPSPYPP